MKTVIVSFCCLLIAFCIRAQDNPKIGTEKGVKEKIIRIKSGLPDIKKNLTIKDETWADQYNVKFEMGNGIVLFDEDKDDGEQSLLIRYTKSYFSGSAADYQNYYKTLVSMFKEVLGSAYDSEKKEKEKEWQTSFYLKGSDVLNSRIRISITCNWMFNSSPGPNIEILIYSRMKTL